MNLTSLWQRIKPTSQFDDELDETPASLQDEDTRRITFLTWASSIFALSDFGILIFVVYQFLTTKMPTLGILLAGTSLQTFALLTAFRVARSKKIVQSVYWMEAAILITFFNYFVVPGFYKIVAPMVFYLILVLIVLFLPRRELIRAMFVNIGAWFLTFITFFFARTWIDQIPGDPTLAGSIQLFGVPAIILVALFILYLFRRISVLSKLMGALSLLTLVLYVVVSSSAQNYALQTVQANADESLTAVAQTQAETVSARLGQMAQTVAFVAGQPGIADGKGLEQYAGLLGADAQVTLLDASELAQYGLGQETQTKQAYIGVADGRILIVAPVPGGKGALSVSYPISTLTSLLAQAQLGATGKMDLFLPDQSLLIDKSGIGNLSAADVEELKTLSQSGGKEVTYQKETVLGQSAPVAGTSWLAVAHQHSSEINAPAIEQGRQIEFLLAMAVGLLWLALVWFSQVVSGPINQLRDVALDVRAGNLQARAKVEGTDEIGLLTGSFNRMTRQLRETLEGLEERVSERTRDLEIASRVAQHITQVLNLDELLPRLVDDTKSGFDLYSVRLFLYDQSQQHLLLAAGTGEAGRQAQAEGRTFSIEARPSIVAQAARERKPVVIEDVSKSEVFFANPLLPETRSEAAIPMVSQGELVGVLDLQSRNLDGFPEANQQILTTLAEQIGVAIKNARLYEAQLQATERLRKVDEMKSQFLASMSHELRTPLNAIINFVEMVAVGMIGPVNTEQKELLNHSLQGSQHLLHLINDVLDISKIQAGQLRLFVEVNVDLNAELDSVLAMVKPLLSKKPIELVQDVDLHLPTVAGDKRRIRQVLLNLLSNAIKFTEKGTVTISAKKLDGQVQFAVADTGPGIPLQAQAQIFEPFVQTETGMKQSEGTGLGLPISRSLVQAHGGRIWLESKPGEGATFFFTLPVTKT